LCISLEKISPISLAVWSLTQIGNATIGHHNQNLVRLTLLRAIFKELSNEPRTVNTVRRRKHNCGSVCRMNKLLPAIEIKGLGFRGKRQGVCGNDYDG
jgi:hypothetical protein